MPKIEPIEPWKITRFFDKLRERAGKGKVSVTLMQAGRTGAFTEVEVGCVEDLICDLELDSDDHLDFGEFLEKELGVAEQSGMGVVFQVSRFLLRVAHTHGVHLTPDERLEAVANKMKSVAWNHSFGHPDIKTVAHWLRHNATEHSYIARIQKGLRDYGFAPAGFEITGKWDE